MKKRLFSIVITMLLLLQAVLPGLAMAETIDQEATLDVSVVAKMNEAFDSALKQPDQTTVTIASLDGAPMPAEETLTFSSDDAKAQSFSVHYDQLGVYRYEVTQTAGSHPSATSYDTQKYLWTVYVLREENGIGTTQVLKAEDGTKPDEAVFTNEYAETHTAVKKIWDDDVDEDGKDNDNKMRPDSLTVTLSNYSGEIPPLSDQNDWQFSVDGLPALKDGEPIDYIWTESQPITDYNLTEVDRSQKNQTVFTNTYTPKHTSYTVTKVWDDMDNRDGLRTDVTLQVQGFIEGIKVPVIKRDVTIAKDATGDDLSVTVNNLPTKYSFKDVTYQVAEPDVPKGYVATVDGAVVTNFHKIAHLTVEKTTTNKPKNGSKYSLGETIEYKITVTNDGNVMITDITLTDTVQGYDAVDLTAELDKTELKPGEVATATYKHEVTEQDILKGEVVNDATATGKDPDGDEPEVEPGTDPEPTDEKNAHLTVEKTTTNKPKNGSKYSLGEKIGRAHD